MPAVHGWEEFRMQGHGLEKTLLTLLGDGAYAVSVRKAGIFRFPSSYRYDRHRHPEIEIDYCTAGSGIMGIGDAYVSFKSGDCLVVYPEVPHSFYVDVRKSCCLTQLEFTVTAPPGLCGELDFLRDAVLGKGPDHRCLRGCETVRGRMEEICRDLKAGDGELSRAALQLDFAQLYLALTDAIRREAACGGAGRSGKIGSVIRYIHENLGEKLDMERICAACGVSSRYIRKKFIEQTGVSSSQYIMVLRIGRAKELLADTGRTVTDVADAAGFASSQYFSRVFRACTGMTPSEYRRRERLWGRDPDAAGREAAFPENFRED